MFYLSISNKLITDFLFLFLKLSIKIIIDNNKHCAIVLVLLLNKVFSYVHMYKCLYLSIFIIFYTSDIR